MCYRRGIVNHNNNFLSKVTARSTKNENSDSMTFWSSQFHKSDAEKSSQKALDDIKDIVQMQVMLGNASTERSLVHDVKTLKVEKEEHRKTIVRLQGDLVKVCKRKGPCGNLRFCVLVQQRTSADDVYRPHSAYHVGLPHGVC